MAPRIVGLVFVLTLAAACGKTEPRSIPDAGPERPHSAPAAAAVSAVKTEPTALAVDPSFQLPAVERIIAIGDRRAALGRRYRRSGKVDWQELGRGANGRSARPR